MRFDPESLTRVADGDATALAEIIHFDDGTTKPLADCDVYDLKVMQAWMRFKAEEADIRADQLHAELVKRGAHLRPIPREAGL